jgi:type IV secretion system protein VirB3
MELKERIYKGATRPPMLLGMSLKAAMPVGGAGVVLSLWGGWWFGWTVFAFFTVLTTLLLLAMRAITISDDQAMNRLMKSLRLTALHRNRKLWGCRSYSPIVYRGRSDVWVR